MTPSFYRIISILFVVICLTSGPVLADESVPTNSSSVEYSPLDLGTMTRVGDMTTVGVRATAYISAVNGPAGSYRVAVVFANEQTGVTLKKAQVGIKHRKLYGKTSDPVWMRAKAEQPEIFISDIVLAQKGTYLLIVGSKLEDDKKRQFTFQHFVQ